MSSHRLHRVSLAPLLPIFFALTSYSQEEPIVWGEIPRADLEMTSYPADTNAAVVILCDFGKSSFNDDLDVVFVRHRRIKILSERGYDWGTHSLVFYAKDRAERVRYIRGTTYTLDQGGEVSIHEMDDDAIFEEDVDGEYRRIRFTLPSLTPGCVIEYTYSVYADDPALIKSWEFQTSEPVRWSEYVVRTPRAIGYTAVYQGFETFLVNEQKEVPQFFSGIAQSYLGGNMIRCMEHRWVLKDAPAIREEPYATTTNDYVVRVDLQLAAYARRTGGVEKVLRDWPMCIDELMDSEHFGQCIDVTGDIRDLAQHITAGLTDPLDRVAALYHWVSSSIVWTGEHRTYSERDVDDVLESRRGTSAEITFLLLALFKSAEIPADPVITSTRSHGRIQKLYPIVSQFNTVLARVQTGRRYYLLDATDPFCPMDMLPQKELKVEGLVVRRGAVEWVALESPKRGMTTTRATMRLGEDGSLTGILTGELRDYDALKVRRTLKDKKETDVVSSTFGTDRYGFAIDSVSISGQDSINRPVTIVAKVSSPAYAQAVGDLIYLNPHLTGRLNENPFRNPTRRFPVNMPFGITHINIIRISLPEGFAVKEAVPNRSFSFGGASATFTRKVQVFSREVLISNRLDIQRTDFSPNEYLELREFYGSVVASEEDQFVLQRIPLTSPAKKK